MSETSTPVIVAQAAHTPTVYFIDDSATMREVIKIAFRKENIHVVACHDAASAIAQMDQTRPDVVISDVIMPDKDGYEVCQHLKQHSQLGRTPVILMSGIVNRTVADKALSVKADELIRKPFLPQELIARVKKLLKPQSAVAPAQTAPSAPAGASDAARAWSNLFPTNAAPPAPPSVALPSAVTVPVPHLPADLRPAPASVAPAPVAPPATPHVEPSHSAALQKLRVEIQRLDQLIKKLRTELDAERQYSRSLEENIKTLQETSS